MPSVASAPINVSAVWPIKNKLDGMAMYQKPLRIGGIKSKKSIKRELKVVVNWRAFEKNVAIEFRSKL
jgi:hypothetical protein